MKIWHLNVGPGRFIVRAENEEQAKTLALEAAKDYFPKRDIPELSAEIQTDLDLEGEPCVLDIDFS